MGRVVRNIQALNEVLRKGAKPWWDFYGGKENIELVDALVSASGGAAINRAPTSRR